MSLPIIVHLDIPPIADDSVHRADQIAEVLGTVSSVLVIMGDDRDLVLDGTEDKTCKDFTLACQAQGISCAIVQAGVSPNLAKALAGNVVPVVCNMLNGYVKSSMIGAASEIQVQAFIVAGVTPVL